MKKINKTGKTLILVSILLILFNTFLGIVLTHQSANAMRDLIRDRMLDISTTAADMLDGDELKEIQKEDYDTPEYQSVLKTLTYFQDNIELEYIYCIRDLGDGNFVFSVDPTIEDPGEFGSPIVYTPALGLAAQGTSAVDEEPYEDEWGRFYSAYSPVFDSAGGVAGIVAVDFSAEWYEYQISRHIWTTIIIIGVALVFSIIITTMIATRYRVGFTRIYKEMNRLSEGIETLVSEVSPEALLVAGSETVNPVDMENAVDEISVIGDKVSSMQDTLRKQIIAIRAQAYFDGLTGLKNRASYEEHVERIDGEIAAGTAAFTVAVFDINHLKTINDEEGHEAGDRVIVEVADALRHIFGVDTVYRIGGDEFTAILDENDPKDRMKEFRRTLKDAAVSMGYAFFDKAADKDYSTVFNRADEAMFADKKEYYMLHKDRRKR